MFYVIKRDEERMVIGPVYGGDPLYGYGSWDFESGPYATWDEAEKELEK